MLFGVCEIICLEAVRVHMIHLHVCLSNERVVVLISLPCSEVVLTYYKKEHSAVGGHRTHTSQGDRQIPVVVLALGQGRRSSHHVPEFNSGNT